LKEIYNSCIHILHTNTNLNIRVHVRQCDVDQAIAKQHVLFELSGPGSRKLVHHCIKNLFSHKLIS